jgi:FdhD protein
MIFSPSRAVARTVHRDGASRSAARVVAEETPVALTYNGATQAVMMATPADLEDFALGFSLTEGIAATPADITEMAIAPADNGIDIRMWLAGAAADRLLARRRYLLGASGCGMCGLESLAEADRALPVISTPARVSPPMIAAALAAMQAAQTLNAATHAVHAAAFWRTDAPLLLREDVGRHNALDKLVGAMARAGLRPDAGIVLLSSRISVEMVQKAALLGAPLLVAVSAPTALAIRTADRAGITLVGVARADGFEIFTHANRIVD